MNQAVKPKKVLYVVTKGAWGGAQRYVYDLATHVPKNQFTASVVCGNTGLLTNKLRQANIPLFLAPSLKRDMSPLSDIKSFFEIYRLCKKLSPHVVHLNSSKAGGIGALAARLAGVPRIVFTVHGWPFWEPRNILAQAAIWFASWLTTLLSHVVIVISDYDLSVAKRMPFVRKKIRRIYNGIDLSMQFGGGEEIRRAFPPGATITGTIGELNRNKNQRALIEQARNDPNMYVAIVGEGEERERLEQYIHIYNLEKRVRLFGFMSAEKVLRGFDRFALPSLKEGLPYVLLEARVAGIPIEANRVGGVGEILEHDLSEFSLEKMLTETVAVYS